MMKSFQLVTVFGRSQPVIFYLNISHRPKEIVIFYSRIFAVNNLRILLKIFNLIKPVIVALLANKCVD